MFVIYLLSISTAATAILDGNCTYFDQDSLSQKFHPTASACEDRIQSHVCAGLFDKEKLGGVTDKSTERAAGCHLANGVHNDGIRTAAVYQCAKYCGYCCLTPEYSCENSRYPRVDCDTLTQGQCRNPMLKPILIQDCPKRCGFCMEGGCFDLDAECRKNPTVCVTSGMEAYVQVHCRLTCGLCSKNSPGIKGIEAKEESGSCVNRSESCEQWIKAGYCTNDFYTEEQKKNTCAKSCNLC